MAALNVHKLGLVKEDVQTNIFWILPVSGASAVLYCYNLPFVVKLLPCQRRILSLYPAP